MQAPFRGRLQEVTTHLFDETTPAQQPRRITTPDREHHAAPWFAAYVAAQATQAKLATINALDANYRFQNNSTFSGTHWSNRTHTMQFGGNKLETTKADEPAK